jgi:hypothetical protein
MTPGGTYGTLKKDSEQDILFSGAQAGSEGIASSVPRDVRSKERLAARKINIFSIGEWK